MSSLRKSSHRGFPITSFLLLASLALFWPACDSGTSPLKTDAAEPAPSAPLPDPQQAGGWTCPGESRRYTGEALFEHIDGGADIYFEYGFDALTLQQYNKDDKVVSLEIYRMSDSAAAFGIYSYHRHPALAPVEVGSNAVIHPDGLFFWQDRYYVNMRRMGPSAVPPDELVALAQALSRKIGTAADIPSIMSLLPQKNRLANTEVFARGKLALNGQVYVTEEDLFRLKKDEAAAVARYGGGQSELSVIIARYTNPETADSAFIRFRNHYLGGESKEDTRFSASTRPGKYNSVGKIGEYLVVVANADTGEKALEMHAAVSEIMKGI